MNDFRIAANKLPYPEYKYTTYIDIRIQKSKY